ncbi:MAG: hydrogenase iron-sulfur subunit [Spirochaetes bacterium]|nr:hydrogenase iron-sulfur subunit [Spirochaetota bacterium]
MDFKPKIVIFVCNWCSYAAADGAGMKRAKYPAGIKLIRVMCSGRVDPQFILQAFHQGADGVMIMGCHPGDCHYKEGNYKALRRAKLLQKILDQLGVEGDRFKLEWVSASEADRFIKVVNEMYENVQKLGPLDYKADTLFSSEVAETVEQGSETTPESVTETLDNNETEEIEQIL